MILLGCISKFSDIGTFITAWLAIRLFSTKASKWAVIQLIELTSYHSLELSCQRSSYPNAFPVNPISQSSAERNITFIRGKMTLVFCDVNNVLRTTMGHLGKQTIGHLLFLWL